MHIDNAYFGAGLAVAAPSFGPTIVSVFGLDIPILALSISLLSLMLARMVAPPSPRKLSTKESWSLTALLCVILFLAVTGEITGKPLGVGMAVVWAVGLGFSGLLIVEALADKVRAMMNVWLGSEGK